MADASDANEDARCICVFNERHLLCVQEAKRLFGLQMCCKAIEQRFLIEVVLNPLGLETEVRLSLWLNI
jgi:hypothetical protein